MDMWDVCCGWKITASARPTDAGFIATGAAVRLGVHPRSMRFGHIDGPFPSERVAVLKALDWMRTWVKMGN
jgi:hypothetical protein